MKKLIALLLSVLLITACFAACGKKADTPDTPADDSGKLNVVCSIFPQYDFIKAIAGDEVNLTLLLDSKTDLHSYTPTADDIMTISKADLFINIGGESDDWAEDVLSSAANDKLHVVSLLKLVDAVEEETLPGMQEEEEHEEAEHEEDGPEYDEHVWTSLKNVIQIIPALTDVLCELDSGNTALYQSNSSAYLAQLEALEAKYSDTIGKAARKTLLFADRFPFRYLADDYGLTCYAAFSGCSAETEASFETMTFLVDTVKEQHLPFVLMIDGSDGSVAETVSRQSGAEIRTLNSCQSVSPDDIAAGASYLTIMENNLAVLSEVLN